jgi:hypothetical protein
MFLLKFKKILIRLICFSLLATNTFLFAQSVSWLENMLNRNSMLAYLKSDSSFYLDTLLELASEKIADQDERSIDFQGLLRETIYKITTQFYRNKPFTDSQDSDYRNGFLFTEKIRDLLSILEQPHLGFLTSQEAYERICEILQTNSSQQSDLYQSTTVLPFCVQCSCLDLNELFPPVPRTPPKAGSIRAHLKDCFALTEEQEFAKALLTLTPSWSTQTVAKLMSNLSKKGLSLQNLLSILNLIRELNLSEDDLVYFFAHHEDPITLLQLSNREEKKQAFLNSLKFSHRVKDIFVSVHLDTIKNITWLLSEKGLKNEELLSVLIGVSQFKLDLDVVGFLSQETSIFEQSLSTIEQAFKAYQRILKCVCVDQVGWEKLEVMSLFSIFSAQTNWAEFRKFVENLPNEDLINRKAFYTKASEFLKLQHN